MINYFYNLLSINTILYLLGLNKKFKMLISNNTSGESDEEIMYDSDKDPEYVLTTPRVKENCKLKKNTSLYNLDLLINSKTIRIIN